MTTVSASPGADGNASPDATPPGAIPRAIAVLGGGEVLFRLVALGTTTLVARRVGPDGFGVLGFASALCGYFALGIGGGLSDLGAREVGRKPGDASRIYRDLLWIRIPLALTSLLLLALLAVWLPRSRTDRVVIVLSGLSLLCTAVDSTWVVKALGRTSLAAIAAVATQCVILAGVVVTVAGPTDVIWVPLIQAVAEGTTTLALVLVAVRAAPGLASHWRDGFALFREAFPLLFGRGMRVIVVSFDMLLLGLIAPSHDVGLYAAVYRVHFFVLALLVAVQTVYLPVMSRAALTANLGVVSRGALAGAAFIGAPLVAGGLVVSAPLLTFFFGAPFAEGAVALQWLLVSLAFAFIHGLFHNLYVVTGQTHVEARWFALAAAINVLANLWLIPRYGIAGAAAATAVAEAVIAFAGLLVTRLASIADVARAWAVPGVAAAVMALVVWATGATTPVLVRCAVGATVYIVAAGALLGPRRLAARLRLQVR